MKKLLSVLFITLLCLSFSGCSLVGLGKTSGKVYAISGGVEFECYGVKISENGELLPGYDIAEVVSGADCTVPYNDDLTIKLEGKRYGEVEYSLYSEEFECDYENSSLLSLPESDETKIVRIRVTWGTAEENEGYDYFFKLER